MVHKFDDSLKYGEGVEKILDDAEEKRNGETKR